MLHLASTARNSASFKLHVSQKGGDDYSWNSNRQKHFLVALTNSSRREMHTLQVAAIFPSPLPPPRIGGRFLRRHFSATHRGGFDAYTGRGRVALSRVFTAASPLSPPLPPAAAAAEGKKKVWWEYEMKNLPSLSLSLLFSSPSPEDARKKRSGEEQKIITPTCRRRRLFLLPPPLSPLCQPKFPINLETWNSSPRFNSRASWDKPPPNHPKKRRAKGELCFFRTSQLLPDYFSWPILYSSCFLGSLGLFLLGQRGRVLFLGQAPHSSPTPLFFAQ